MSEVKPDWVKIKPAEMDKIVISLFKEGNTPAKIGLILRDKHGIPKAKLLGRRVSKILREEGLVVLDDRLKVKDRITNLERHIKDHRHDYTALRSISKKLWIVKKIKE